MAELTPQFAEILGLLCAEGCHAVSYCTYLEVDRGRPRLRRNKKSETIQLYNKDEKLLLHYTSLLNVVFSYPARVSRNGKVNIGAKHMMRAILNHTPLGCDKWKVPLAVRRANKEIKLAFVRGYFDGDGTSSSTVRFFSINKDGLLGVFSLLTDLRFKPTFQGPIIKKNRRPSYIIQISRKERERFLNEIKPVSKLPARGLAMRGLSSGPRPLDP